VIRIGAGIVAVAFAVLLGWTIAASVGAPSYVVPTQGVIDGGKHDPLPTGPEAVQRLADRAALQRWRAESGPSPGAPEPPALSGSSMPPGEAIGAGGANPADWAATRDRYWQILREPQHLAGRVNLPADQAGVLVQPEGRTWRQLQNGVLTYGGGWIVFGVSLVLAVFLLLRGRIPLELGFSGETVTRFSGLERANHWMTATSFIVLALSGLMILYGRHLLKPLIGAGAYDGIAAASLYLHIAFAAPFVLGVAVMIGLWLRQNLPSRLDLHWLARFGGFIGSDPVKPPARRFNAGQKIVFWGVALGGTLLFVTGLWLMFPFFGAGIQGMQTMLVVHAAIALLMVGLILGHIYIGTVGMVGAFDAMWSGEVDRNWAEEHHTLWLAELEGRPPEELQEEMRQHRHAVPAE
jgi:formate dehydrogenase subunit gamma